MERDFLGLMEFKTITMEWKHREKAKYLTTEANWIIRRSHAMQNVGFVLKGALVDFPVDNRTKERPGQVTRHHLRRTSHGSLWGAAFLVRHVPGQH